MRNCANCHKDFKTYAVIDGKKKNLGHRKFCIECSPWGLHNTRKELTPREKKITCGCGRIYRLDKAKGHLPSACNSCVQKKRQTHRRKQFVAVYGNKCLLCGYDKCFSALDYHHVEPSNKKFRIGEGLNRSLKELTAEADKCIVVCCRCHREIHAGEIAQEAVRECWASRVKASLLQGEDAGFDPQNTH